jgi:hypothetical protein
LIFANRQVMVDRGPKLLWSRAGTDSEIYYIGGPKIVKNNKINELFINRKIIV